MGIIINEKTDVYVFEIENTNDVKSKFVLFGFNKFYLKKDENFGSDKGVCINKITNNYSELVSEIAFNPFISSRLRISSENAENLKKALSFYYCKCNRMISDELIIDEYYDVYQSTDKLLDIEIEYMINSGVYFQGVIEPKSKIRMSFTIKKQICITNTLLPEVEKINKIKYIYNKIKLYFKILRLNRQLKN